MVAVRRFCWADPLSVHLPRHSFLGGKPSSRRFGHVHNLKIQVLLLLLLLFFLKKIQPLNACCLVLGAQVGLGEAWWRALGGQGGGREGQREGNLTGGKTASPRALVRRQTPTVLAGLFPVTSCVRSCQQGCLSWEGDLEESGVMCLLARPVGCLVCPRAGGDAQSSLLADDVPFEYWRVSEHRTDFLRHTPSV